MTNIFISYRRTGGREIARTVYLALGKLGYQNIFFDYNSLRNGVFNTQIIDAINECKDFILILTASSMDRCSNEDDWVRKEISTAINAGCNIIPIKIDDQFNEFPTDFPRNLNVLKMIQQSTLLTNEYFDDSIRHISERLESTPASNSVQSKEDNNTFVLNISPDETCEFFVDGERISKIKGQKVLRFNRLKVGKEYELVFNSLASKNLTYKTKYLVPKMKSQDEIFIPFTQIKEAQTKKNAEIEKRNKEERENKRIQKENLRNMLKMYDNHDIKAYNDMTLVCKDDKCGFLDAQGLEVIPCIYDDALHFSEGLACVVIDGKWEYLDVYGNRSFNIGSDTPSYCIDSVIVYSHSNKYGLIDKAGNKISECVYDFISLPKNGILVAKLDNRFLYIGLNGEKLSQYSYDDVPFDKIGIRIEGNKAQHEYYYNAHDTHFLLFPQLPGKVCLNKKYGFVNQFGTQIIPCIASEMIVFQERRQIRAKVNGKWGMFDYETGKITVPFLYSFIYDPYHDYKIENLLSLYDRGEPIIYVAKESNIVVDKGLDKEFDTRCIATDSLGVLSISGNILIPLDYNYIFFDYESWSYIGINIIDYNGYSLPQIIDAFYSEARMGSRWYPKSEYVQNILSSCSMIKKEICYKADFYRSYFGPNEEMLTLNKSELWEFGTVKHVYDYYVDDRTESHSFSYVPDISNCLDITHLTVNINKYDRIEVTKREDYAIAYKGDKCGVFDNLSKKMLTEFCFDVLTLSEIERVGNSNHERCHFNFAADGKRGIFQIILLEDGRILVDCEILKITYKDEEIKSIFGM